MRPSVARVCGPCTCRRRSGPGTPPRRARTRNGSTPGRCGSRKHSGWTSSGLRNRWRRARGGSGDPHDGARRRLAPGSVRPRSSFASQPPSSASACRQVDVELARTDAERDEGRAAASPLAKRRARRGRESRTSSLRRLERYDRRPASSWGRSIRWPRRSTTPRRYGLEGALSPACRSREVAERAREAARRSDEDCRDALRGRRSLPWSITSTRVAATLFPGGEGRLRLTEAEEDGEEAGHRGGAAPPRARRRDPASACLSGGEKALGRDRIPLLALSSRGRAQFYLLDEGRGGAPTTRTSVASRICSARTPTRAQFIVITPSEANDGSCRMCSTA